MVRPGKRFKFTWEHGVMLALGSAALISSGLLWFQWKPATMGRRVKKDLVSFLKVHGAQVDGNKISGGPVTIPMTVDEAVVGTIDTIISDINSRTKRTPAAGSAAAAAGAGAAGAPRQGQGQGQGAAAHNRTPDVVAAAAAAAAAAASNAQGGGIPRSGRSQGRAPAQGQMMMPAGASAGQGQGQAQGQAPASFPEPPVSGRTGRPVVEGNEPTMQLPQALGGMTHDSQGEVPQGDDFSYMPPIPPGMRPPGANM